MKESAFNIHFDSDNRCFVYNTKYNGLIEVETPDLISLTQFREELYDQGFIVEANKDEFQLLIEETQQRIQSDFFRLDLTVLLTEKCNLQCVYCYQHHKPIDMNTVDASKLLNMIDEAVDLLGYKEIRVCYFGGEPLINWDVLLFLHQGLCQLAAQKEIEYVPMLTTNATLLTSEMLAKISFDTIQITLEGMPRTHEALRKSPEGSFDKILLNIETVLRETDANIKIRINLCKENHKEIREFVQFILNRVKEYFDRITITISLMQKHFETEAFHMLTRQEYVSSYLDGIKALVECDKKLLLPRSMATPCSFMAGIALCLSPRLHPIYCSGTMQLCDETFEISSMLLKRKPFVFPVECQRCNILPLCMCGCNVTRFFGMTPCAPEKEILIEYLKLFIYQNFNEK